MARTTQIGPYRLLEVLGRGEIFTIFDARDTQHDRSLLVKQVHPHLSEDADLIYSLRRQAELLLGLRHPLIVPFLDVSISPEAVYVLTDVPSGVSLEQKLADHGPLEIDDVLSIVSQVAKALDYAHAQGVFHHDVRPANIYVDGETTRLADFFLLEAIGATPIYMAPEQLDATGVETADHRADIYALDVVAYEMLTSRPPFRGESQAVTAAHLTQRPAAPRVHNPDLLPALDAILLKGLAKQPHGRYQSAGDLALALHQAVQVAQTRRMDGAELFDSGVRPAGQEDFSPLLSDKRGGLPMWVWVGIGILLIVVIAVVVLLATA